MRERLLALGIVAAVAMWPGSQVNAAAAASGGPLGLRVPSYDVQGVPIIEALRHLKLAVSQKTLILTLEVARFQQEPEENLTLSLRNSTVREALDRITSLDARYTYCVAVGEVIHIFPRGAKSDPDDLLNTKVKTFTTSGVPYDRLLQYPNYYIPELAAELARRSKAGGVVGVMMSSTGVPRVTVEIQNATVRDILNQISLQAAKVSKSPAVPTGWLYTFRIDKSVPLGGHAHWQLF